MFCIIFNFEEMIFQNLTRNQIQEFRQIYNLFDHENHGAIKNRKLKTILSALGHHLDNDQINNLIEVVDKDKSGTIDFEEFIFMMAMGCQGNGVLMHDALQIFQFIDSNGDGTITKQELFNVLYKEVNKDEESKKAEIAALQQFIETIFNDVDQNNDGELSLREFVQLILAEK